MSGAFARIGIAVVGFESEEAVSDGQSVRTPVGHRSHDLGRKPNIVHDFRAIHNDCHFDLSFVVGLFNAAFVGDSYLVTHTCAPQIYM